MRRTVDVRSCLYRYGPFAVAAAVFILTGLVNVNVRLYGDDFHYERFVSGNLQYYFIRHLEHYFLANGRVAVHLLATLFLGIHRHLWCLANSLMLAGIVYFGAKAASGEGRDKKEGAELYSAVIIGTAIFFLEPVLTRQSVYWVTGSFNYVYPAFILVLYWHLLQRAVEKDAMRWYIPVLAFITAATVEQASLMTFGLTLITAVELRWLQNKKINRMLLFTLAAAFLGMLTVIASPAVFYRASLEASPAMDLPGLIKYNILQQKDHFLSKVTVAYHLPAMAAALGVVLKYRGRFSPRWNRVESMIIAVGAAACVEWLRRMLTGAAPAVSGRPQLFFELSIMAGYILLMVYAGVIAYARVPGGSRTLPLTAVILGFGSQLMMLVSPVFGLRNLVFAIIMLALFTAALLPELHAEGISAVCASLICFIFDVPWLLPLSVIAFLLIVLRRGGPNAYAPWGITAGYAVTAIVALTVLLPTIRGYAVNAAVYDNNMKIVREYLDRDSEGELVQYKLPAEVYGWVMPYHNEYYKVYYNLYIGVDKNTDIVWK